MAQAANRHEVFLRQERPGQAPVSSAGHHASVSRNGVMAKVAKKAWPQADRYENRRGHPSRRAQPDEVIATARLESVLRKRICV
jgi:hypothetical protein